MMLGGLCVGWRWDHDTRCPVRTLCKSSLLQSRPTAVIYPPPAILVRGSLCTPVSTHLVSISFLPLTVLLLQWEGQSTHCFYLTLRLVSACRLLVLSCLVCFVSFQNLPYAPPPRGHSGFWNADQPMDRYSQMPHPLMALACRLQKVPLVSPPDLGLLLACLIAT